MGRLAHPRSSRSSETMYKEIFCRNAQDLSKGILSELSTSALEYQNVAEVTRTLCDQHRVIVRKLFWLRDVAGLCFTNLVTELVCWPSTFDGMTAIAG